MNTLLSLSNALAIVFLVLAILFLLIFLYRLIRKRDKKWLFLILAVVSLGLHALSMYIHGDVLDYKDAQAIDIYGFDHVALLQDNLENTNTIFDASENVAFLDALQNEEDVNTLAAIVADFPTDEINTLSEKTFCQAVYYTLTGREDLSNPLPVYAAFLPRYKTSLEEKDPHSRNMSPDDFLYQDDQVLLNNCGTDPKGKAIVYTYQQKSESEENIYALHLGKMNSLPEELLPNAPEEVAYVVYIEQSIKHTGTYLPLNGTSVWGYRTDVSIALYKMPGMELIEDFGTVMGGELGDRISLPAEPDQSAIFGKDPDPEEVERLLTQAIAAIPR